MSGSGNGDKTRVIGWLVGILQVIILTACAWVGTSVVQAKTDIAVLQSNYTELDKKLARIEGKLDKLFSDRDRGRRGEWANN